jgi:cyclase
VTLARRIVPCLDVRDGRVVKGTRFVGLRDAGDPVELARRYDGQGADELVFLDITASAERRGTVVELAARVADVLFIPFTVGGGIRSAGEAGEILRAGADKVAVNSAAVRNPSIIGAIASRFGSQACVLAIDARRREQRTGEDAVAESSWEVVIDGGRTPTGRDAVEWARAGIERGAGEILLTSMDTDGTRLGFDLALTNEVATAVGVPVIASGGASGPADFVALFERTPAEAGLAASIFHYGETAVGDVKTALAAAKIPVRPAEAAWPHDAIDGAPIPRGRAAR